jgi:hypothetical protein
MLMLFNYKMQNQKKIILIMILVILGSSIYFDSPDKCMYSNTFFVGITRGLNT